MKISSIALGLLLLGASSAMGQVPERFSKQGKNQKDSLQSKPAGEVVQSQSTRDQESGGLMDKLVWGGNLGLSFGGRSAFIYLAPSVGYNFTKKFTAGIGFIYQYARVTYQSGRSFENSIYGPTLFANYRPLENFYGATQFEYLNHDFRASSLRENNIWSPVWFIEAGMSQPIGEKGFATIGIRYNLLDNPQSPYSSAWFPVIGIYF